MEIYLAILEDRHIDIQIEPFKTLPEALEQIREWQSNALDDEWIEEEIDGWEYYVRSKCEDGPNLRVEKKELK